MYRNHAHPYIHKCCNRIHNNEFEILDQNVPSVVLQLPTAIELNLIKRTYTVDKHTTPDNNDFYEKYEDDFDGLGRVS